MSSIETVIGARIAQARKESEMSQSELGEVLGVSFQQVQKYEKGINRISASSLKRVADHYALPLDLFFTPIP